MFWPSPKATPGRLVRHNQCRRWLFSRMQYCSAAQYSVQCAVCSVQYSVWAWSNILSGNLGPSGLTVFLAGVLHLLPLDTNGISSHYFLIHKDWIEISHNRPRLLSFYQINFSQKDNSSFSICYSIWTKTWDWNPGLIKTNLLPGPWCKGGRWYLISLSLFRFW